MMSTLNIRRPGVYFLPASGPVRRLLPALDVAAFVGLAERGPLHTPVPVEDVNTYRAVFGNDMPLAREPGGRVIYANLPKAVITFFANGGRRCYVVRVAGEEASRSRFRVPGMIALGPHATQKLAAIEASTEGRWSASLRLATALRRTPLPTSAFEVVDTQHLRWETGDTPLAIQPGDLLRLTFEDEVQWLFPVTNIAPRHDDRTDRTVTLVALRAWQVISSVTATQPLIARRIDRLTLDGVEPLAGVSAWFPRTDNELQLVLTGAGAGRVRSDDVLRLELSDGSMHLFPITELRSESEEASPPGSQMMALAAYMLQLLPSPMLPAGSPPTSLLRVERLHFDLQLWQGQQQRVRLSELAFNLGHPRFWGDVALLESSPLRRSVDDTSGARAVQAAQLFREMRQGKRREEAREDRLDVIALTGLLAPLQQDREWTYLPVGMPTILQESNAIGPSAANVGHDALEAFNARLFLDHYLVPNPQIQSPSGKTLMQDAFNRFYGQNMRLRGLHSLLFADEVAVVSIPDAVHRGWKQVSDSEMAQETPAPPTPPQPDRSRFLNCEQPPTVLAVMPSRGPLQGGLEVLITGTGFTTAADTAVTFGNQAATNVQVVGETMLRCKVPTSVVVGLVTVTVVTHNGAGSQPNAFTYERPLAEPLSPAPIPMLPVSLPQDPLGDTLRPDDPLLQIQQALINVCQARRDVLGILTLPLHFEKRQCLQWHDALRQRLGLPSQSRVSNGTDDMADLSYVAVYHPWLLVADASAPGGLRAVPCDGAVCGMIAARERERQVWVAPANVALQDVLGLTPVFSTDDWEDMFARQMNLVRPEPSDFRAMNAHTLSDASELLQVSVRRLMILLRKVAAARGMDFVFETNHQQFREGVRVILEDLLRFMFERGAFAGATAEQAFRVVTDASVNTPQSIDQGRFIAHIQVAPSQPMEFITVLLTRTGDGLLATEV
jgi:IPT/TIG domain